ncbi:MAG: hypothetical protein ACXVEF_34135 [Polyangiales bacterium]
MSAPPFRPFRPRRAQTVEQARAVGRAWADHEATDPASLKGHPSEGRGFFFAFEEAAELVDAATMALRRELVAAVEEGACARWTELADGPVRAWGGEDE